MVQRQDLRVVVAGGGRVGLRTSQMLKDRGHDVIIIEKDPFRVEQLSDEYVATIIEGDATHPSILRQADLDKCDVIASLTGRAGLNLGVCLAAQRLTDDIRTVMRIDSADDEPYAEFVDDIVFPEGLGSRSAASAIIGSDVRAMEEIMVDLEMLEVRVAANAPAAGRRLEEVRFPRGSLVISDYDGHQIARPDTVLEPDQRYIIAAEPGVVDEVMNLLRG